MKSYISFTILLFVLITPIIGQEIEIDGPEETCPNHMPLTYHIYAKNFLNEKVQGSFKWDVYVNGVYRPEWSQSTTSCYGSGYEVFLDISQPGPLGGLIWGWQEVGDVEIRVEFIRANLNPFCNAITKTKYITSSGPDPGIPVSASGELTICPGESREVYMDPSLPTDANTLEYCFFHHQYDWTAPLGWTLEDINVSGPGSNNELRTSDVIKITAPNSVTPGSGNHILRVEGEDLYPWITPIEREIEIGLPSVISITGNPYVCITNSSFSLDYFPPNVSVNWSVSPTNLFAIDNGTGNTFVTRATNTNVRGEGIITASISSPCGNKIVSRQVWVGNPDQAHNYDLFVQGNRGVNPINLAGGALYTFEISDLGTQGVEGATSYIWQLPSGFSFLSGYLTTNYVAKIWTSNSSGNYILKCYPQNSCGNTGSGFQSLDITIGGSCPNPPCSVPVPALVISPNPTYGEFDMSFESIDDLEAHLNQLEFPMKVEIFSIQGEKHFHGVMTKNGLHINLENASTGLYIVKVLGKNYEYTASLMIE